MHPGAASFNLHVQTGELLGSPKIQALDPSFSLSSILRVNNSRAKDPSDLLNPGKD